MWHHSMKHSEQGSSHQRSQSWGPRVPSPGGGGVGGAGGVAHMALPAGREEGLAGSFGLL